MDHSLEKYLEKLSPTELKNAWCYYLEKNKAGDYEYELSEIFRILQSRGNTTSAYEERPFWLYNENSR